MEGSARSNMKNTLWASLTVIGKNFDCEDDCFRHETLIEAAVLLTYVSFTFKIERFDLLLAMREHQVVIYGSYGYTGSLIAGACKARGLNVLLAGRNGKKLEAQSGATGYPYEAADIADAPSLRRLLGKGNLVIHCAGPFQETAKQMVEACLETRTHYIDITGEYGVFEMLAAYDFRGREKEVLIMPGAGFDVVPSDCVAVHLKNRLPNATHLQLAFTMSKGGLSRGTARTMIEGLGHGSMIRKAGKLTPVRLGQKVLEVNFGDFSKKALCIPWGDIATAWRSTGIPNIEIYSGVPAGAIQVVKCASWFNWILKKRWLKDFLRRIVDRRRAGPYEQRLKSGRSYLWGRVRDNKGNVEEARLKTLNGYLLTGKVAVLISEKLLSGGVRGGYFTPAQYFGERLIFEIEGTEWI
jgi:short subunit dehydrogenase-like uncharacterized protein